MAEALVSLAGVTKDYPKVSTGGDRLRTLAGLLLRRIAVDHNLMPWNRQIYADVIEPTFRLATVRRTHDDAAAHDSIMEPIELFGQFLDSRADGIRWGHVAEGYLNGDFHLFAQHA